MALHGSHHGLLDEKHATGCDNGTEYSAMRPVVVDDPEHPGETIVVMLMEWCGDCSAADYEIVDICKWDA